MWELCAWRVAACLPGEDACTLRSVSRPLEAHLEKHRPLALAQRGLGPSVPWALVAERDRALFCASFATLSRVLAEWRRGPSPDVAGVAVEPTPHGPGLCLAGDASTFKGLYAELAPSRPRALHFEVLLAAGAASVHVVLAEKKVTWAVSLPLCWLEVDARERSLRLLQPAAGRPQLLVLRELGRIPKRFGSRLRVTAGFDWAQHRLRVRWRGETDEVLCGEADLDPRRTAGVLCCFAKGPVGSQGTLTEVRVMGGDAPEGVLHAVRTTAYGWADRGAWARRGRLLRFWLRQAYGREDTVLLLAMAFVVLLCAIYAGWDRGQ